MARSDDLTYLIEQVSELQRQAGMTFRQARVSEFKKGKVRLWLDDKQDQGGQAGGSSLPVSSASGLSSGSSAGSSGSSDSGDGEWKSPWMWGAETHFGNAREDIPYKKDQNVLVIMPGGDPAQAFVLPGPPSSKQKLPVHQDDKEHTYQTEKFKSRRTVDGKTYAFWQDDQKEDTQAQQGGSSTSSSSASSGSGGQTAQQQAKILNSFTMDEEGGIVITSAKGIKLQIKDGGHDGGTKKESGKIKQQSGQQQGKVSTLTVTPTGAKWEVEESGAKTTWEMTKEKVTQRVGDGQKVEWTKEQTVTTDGKIKHGDKNIGKDHKHGQVQPGGGKTGDPEAE